MFLKELHADPTPYRRWVAESAQRIAAAFLRGKSWRGDPAGLSEQAREDKPDLAIWLLESLVGYLSADEMPEYGPPPEVKAFLVRLRDEFREADRLVAQHAIGLVEAYAPQAPNGEETGFILEMLTSALFFWALGLSVDDPAKLYAD